MVRTGPVCLGSKKWGAHSARARRTGNYGNYYVGRLRLWILPRNWGEVSLLLFSSAIPLHCSRWGPRFRKHVSMIIIRPLPSDDGWGRAHLDIMDLQPHNYGGGDVRMGFNLDYARRNTEENLRRINLHNSSLTFEDMYRELQQTSGIIDLLNAHGHLWAVNYDSQ